MTTAADGGSMVERPLSVNGEHPDASHASAGIRYLGAGGTFRLEPPRLRTTDDTGEERHATWFELFFDLVFAAAVGELAASLAQHPGATTFARFVVLFVVVVWPWVLYTLYSNRFDTDDVIFRLAKSGAMLAIAAVTVELRKVIDGAGGGAGFAIGYVVLRAFLISLYLRAIYDVGGEGRRLSQIYAVGYSATTLVWLASVFVPSPLRYVLWAAAMVIDLMIPTRAWAALKAQVIVVSHLTERFGTFFIIVLGQAIVAVVAGVAGFEFTLLSWVVAGICVLIALCLWWIYFDLADTSVVGRGVLGLIYVYGHFPLLAGVAAFGVGIKLAITQVPNPALSAAARWALSGGVAAFVFSLAVIHIGAEWTSMHDRTFIGRILLVILAVALAVGGGAVPPVAFVALLAGGVLGQLLLEALTPRAGAATVVEPQSEQPESRRAPESVSGSAS